jgi:hypothetical protein
VPSLVFTSGAHEDGIRTRFSPELVYFYKQVGFAAQYFQGEQHFMPSATSPLMVGVPEKGFYVMTSYLLTGETRTT